MAGSNLNHFSSIIFTSDDDDDINQTNDNNNLNLLDIAFSTPSAKQYHSLDSSPTTPPKTQSKKSKRTSTNTVPRTATTTRDHYELIDLVTPTKLSFKIDQQQDYKPRTLNFYSEQRRSILPTFPVASYSDTIQLLLANVPSCQLSSEELARRQPGKYRSRFTIINADPYASSIMMKTYYNLFVPLLERFHCDLVILDHNYAQLKSFIELFRSARNRILSSTQDHHEHLVDLNEHELPQLLEFYLQIDVDLFYMKTCSFRGAHPRLLNEGLFCSTTTPQCLYAMSRCGNCELCSKINTTTTTTASSIHQQLLPVRFDHYERHRFVNGYESILNCPANCNTKNFLYVLTCACGQYDFISETKFPLGVRLHGHRRIANNLIRKFLVGEQNLKNIQLTDENKTSTHKANMLLYRHTMQCSAAIQLFLNENPLYWAFVPMLIDEANQQNQSYQTIRHTKTSMSERASIVVDNQQQLRNDTTVFLQNIPKPPPTHKFSKHQIQKQIDFFKSNRLHEPFNDQVDIYQAAIIVLLPPNTSDLFRRIVHSMFVTHAETKLNTLGHIFDSSSRNIQVRHGTWCTNLVRHRT